MAIQQKVQFIGMDQDSQLRMMEPGSYRYALNVHVGSTKGNNLGAVENVQGNTLVTTTLPSGNNKVIGAYEDRTSNSVFYFLCNSNSDHGIYRYYSDSNTITKVFEWAGLGFNESHIITGVGFLGGTLYWTDGINPQRALNLDSIASFQAPYVEEYISLIKRPPNLQPTCIFGLDATFPNNYIRGKFFQFRTQFVYIDNTVSTLSPVSMLAYGDINRVDNNPRIPGINFNVATKFAYTTGGGNTSPTPTNIASFNVFPSSNNYINVNLNVISEVFTTNAWRAISKVNILVREGNTGKWGIWKTVTAQRIVLSGQDFRFYNDQSAEVVSDELSNKLFDSVPTISSSLSIMKNRVFLANNTEGYDQPDPITFTSTPNYSVFDGNLLGSNIFKNRGYYGVGLVFYDKYMRSSGVVMSTPNNNPLTNSSVRISSGPLISNSTFYFTQSHCTSVSVGLPNNYNLPEWAHYYSIVRTNNLDFGYFIRIIPQQININSNTQTATIRYDAGSPDQAAYNFTEGDMMYFETEDGGVVTGIFGIDSNGYLKVDAKPFLAFYTTSKKIIGAEIYSPSTRLSTDLYYEVGSVYKVSNPGQANRQFSNLTPSIKGDTFLTTRKFYVKNGDSLVPGARFTFIIPIESLGLYAETYETSNSDIGRVNIVVDDGTQEHRAGSIRFSNQFIQGSKINGLSTFDAGDIETISNDYGSINKLQVATNNQSEGDVMLAIFTNAIASIYVGEALIRDNTGSELLSATANVIGSWRILRGNVGTTNPESVVQQNGSVYGFDVTRGIVWRYAQDGIAFLSDRGMKTHFYELSRNLLANGSYHAYGAFDPYFNEYILSISCEENNETVAYSETRDRWTTFYSFLPEWMSKVNTKMISFVNGETWLHASNSVYGAFYGDNYSATITAICNADPSKEKILQSINTESEHVWVATSITTPEGQESSLQETDYYRLANAWNANVLRDINTPNIQSPQVPILQGDWMRSSVFEIEMNNDQTEFSPLYFANFKVIPSERSNK